MRILVISYYFAPQNLIGAVRATKLAKYLSRMGHEVTVICGAGRNGEIDPTLARDLQEMKDVHCISEWNPLRSWYLRKEQTPAAAAPAAAAPAQQSAVRRTVRAVRNLVYISLRWLADRSFSRMGRRELKKLSGTYDAVYSSYAPFSVHEIARKAKKSGLAGRWVADFRDEVGMPFKWQDGRKRRYLAMLRRDADVLCAVSRGFLEMMGYDDVGRVLSNGFDREDLPAVERRPADGCLRVVYCGQFNMGRKGIGDRDLTPMFAALKKLVDEGAIEKERIRLVYAGREGALMRRFAASCGLEECVEDYGQVSREKSIELQRSADILLMASWHMASQKGILTGKLFEYMMMDKPIVCCMEGDLPNSGVKQVLEETGMGFCWERVGGPAEDEQLLAYVRSLVQRHSSGGSLLDGKNDEAVERYAYPGLARQLEGWFNA